MATVGASRGGNTNITIHAPNYIGSRDGLIRSLVNAKRHQRLDVLLL